MPAQTRTPVILLLAETEQAASLDRRALRDAGFGMPKIMTSGIAAASFLAGLENRSEPIPDMVVCSQKLEDMDGEQFCAIVRQHPRLLALPILMIMPNDSEAEQLKSLGCGASALLGRPYSVDALRSSILALMSAAPRMDKLKVAAQEADTSAFNDALATYGILLRTDKQPEDYFRVGMRCLEEGRWNVAISAFQHALRNAEIKAEAELGIASAFKGKGDMPRFRAWLGRAAETLVRAKRWHLARSAFARLLQHDPEAKNPFLSEAHRLIRDKQYEQAATALIQGLSVIPKAKTGERLASVCLSAEDPRAMYKVLAEALGREGSNPDDYLGSEIRQSLEVLGRERGERQKKMAAERKRQLSRQMAASSAAARAKSESEQRTGPAAPKNDAPVVSSLDEPDVAAVENSLDGGTAEEAAEDFSEAGPVLEPLNQEEATIDLFSKKPRINEILSVVKLTMKLAKRSRKK